MVIDWEASKEEWIAAMLKDVAAKLRGDVRFPSASACIGKFEEKGAAWRKNGDFRQVIEFGNEVAAAAAILETMKPDETLHYEPRLANTGRNIDFLITAADGTRRWIDMKTVAPLWKDDDQTWEKYVKVRGEMPGNAALIVEREWSGAAMGSQAINARLSFLRQTVQLEEKIALMTPGEQGEAHLLLCTDGTWHEDDLEDFADFYRTGEFRSDDWMRNGLTRYMTDEKITLARTVKGFIFMKRRQEEVSACKFRIDVKGPQFD